MTVGQSAQQEGLAPERGLLRHGSIYDRLDRAREERMKLLATPEAANIDPQPKSIQKRPTISKKNLLPELKSQEVFDTSREENNTSSPMKVGLGLLAFAAMAGFTLTDWRSSVPAMDVTAPSQEADQQEETILPATDEEPRLAGNPEMVTPTLDSAPSGVAPLSDSVSVDVLLDAPDLEAPPTPQAGSMADLILNVISEDLVLR